MSDSYFPRWRPSTAAVVAPDERLGWPQTLAIGAQHVAAMFGATVLALLLMGFDANVAILMSGIGTLIFFVAVGGRVPSYLGSSFAFIGVVVAATGYAGAGPNPNIGAATGGIIACGVLYAAIGLLVAAVGTGWIERLMPPVVTGAVVAVIGLNLAPIAVKSATGTGFDAWVALLTIVCVGGVAVFARGLLQRLLILVGLVMAYGLYALLANGLALGRPIDFAGVRAAAWLGLPRFTAPTFSAQAIALIAPVALILVAENLGHVKAVAAMTGRNLDGFLGRAFIGDGVATVVSGAAGGTGVTTYAENIGVMAVTRIYSSLVFVVAALIAIVLGFSPKFGALIGTIPAPVLGGVSVVVFGLIAVAGARIWVDNRVDFSDNRNLIVAAVTLVLGAGDFTVRLGDFALGGIGTATFGAIALWLLLGARGPASGPSGHAHRLPVASMTLTRSPTMETGQPRHHGSAPVDVDAIDLLSNDHRLVREYFQHIESVSQTATAADRHRKPDLVRQLCDELDIHAQIEEEIFYPAVRAAFKETDDALIKHAYHEHGQAKALIAELRRMQPDDSRMDEVLQQLKEAVEHHVHEEEERMFTRARSQIDAMAVGRQLRQQKQSLQEQMFGKC